MGKTLEQAVEEMSGSRASLERSVNWMVVPTLPSWRDEWLACEFGTADPRTVVFPSRVEEMSGSLASLEQLQSTGTHDLLKFEERGGSRASLERIFITPAAVSCCIEETDGSQASLKHIADGVDFEGIAR